MARVPSLTPDLVDFAPHLITTLCVAAVVGGGVARFMGIPLWRVALWAAIVAAPLAYTWSASLNPGTPGCTIGYLPWDTWPPFGAGDAATNVLLLVPGGAAAFLWPVPVQRVAALIATGCAPVLIEFGQGAQPALNRACQLGDIINNGIGLAVGWCLMAGTVVLVVVMREVLTSARESDDYARPRGHT